MKKQKFILMVLLIAIFISSVVSFVGAKENVRIVMLVKNLGNAYIEAEADGGREAAKELGDVEFIYQGPTTATAEGQIEIMDSLIAQKVDAIAIQANDVDALVPICKRAMKSGIKVISFDSELAPEGRILHLDQASPELIGRSEVKVLAKLINYKGEIAILSATSQATNQNTWIKWMKEELKEPAYKDMNLVAVVYGDDLSDKSYREAMGLFKSYPNLRGIIAPTTVGIAATGKALEDAGKSGKIELTGLGLPSEMKQYIKDGTCRKMLLWNPIDFGYFATYVAYRLAKGEIEGKEGEVIQAGRMGEMKIEDKDGSGDLKAILGPPYVFDKDNIDKFAAIY